MWGGQALEIMKLICSIDLISLTSYFQFKNKKIKQRTDFKLELVLIKFSFDIKLLW